MGRGGAVQGSIISWWRGGGKAGERLPSKESGPDDVEAETEENGWLDEVLLGTTEPRRPGRCVVGSRWLES